MEDTMANRQQDLDTARMAAQYEMDAEELYRKAAAAEDTSQPAVDAQAAEQISECFYELVQGGNNGQ